MQIHEILRALREDNDKTQSEIAEILKTSQGYYSKYELGKREIPTHHIKTLCLYYGISADYILGLPDDLKYPKR